MPRSSQNVVTPRKRTPAATEQNRKSAKEWRDLRKNALEEAREAFRNRIATPEQLELLEDQRMKNANARKRNREYRDRLKKKLAEKAQAEQAARKNAKLAASGHRKDAGQGVSEDGEFEWDSDYNLGRETDADGETDDECPPEKTKTAHSLGRVSLSARQSVVYGRKHCRKLYL